MFNDNFRAILPFILRSEIFSREALKKFYYNFAALYIIYAITLIEIISQLLQIYCSEMN